MIATCRELPLQHTRLANALFKKINTIDSPETQDGDSDPLQGTRFSGMKEDRIGEEHLHLVVIGFLE